MEDKRQKTRDRRQQTRPETEDTDCLLSLSLPKAGDLTSVVSMAGAAGRSHICFLQGNGISVQSSVKKARGETSSSSSASIKSTARPW